MQDKTDVPIWPSLITKIVMLQQWVQWVSHCKEEKQKSKNSESVKNTKFWNEHGPQYIRLVFKVLKRETYRKSAFKVSKLVAKKNTKC